MELTRQQIERQDFVDNNIYQVINDLIPSNRSIEWDIESIGTIRDSIQQVLIDKGLCSEQEFYPYIED